MKSNEVRVTLAELPAYKLVPILVPIVAKIVITNASVETTRMSKRNAAYTNNNESKIIKSQTT